MTQQPQQPRVRRSWPASSLLAGLCAALALWGGSAWAQDVRASQRKLNQDAQKAAAAKNYDRAEELLKASLELGELNITQLNLGRVYALSGRCWDAKAAYERAAVAPKVQEPSPAKVGQTLARYNEELRQRCPGALVLGCASPGARLWVDGAPAMCGERVELPAGAHLIEARWGEQRAEQRVEVAALEVREVSLERPAERSAPLVPLEPLPQAQPRGEGGAWLRGLGWSFGGVGLSALLGGAAARFHAEGPLAELRDLSRTPGGNLARYHQLKQVVERDELWFISGLGVGAGCLTLSGLLLYWGYGGDEEPAPPPDALRLWVAPRALGVEGRF